MNKKQENMVYVSGFYIGKGLLKQIRKYQKKSGLNKMSPTLRFLLQAGLNNQKDK